MPVNLSIENAPDDVVARLRERALRHDRSLEGELMAIIEDAVRDEPRGAAAAVLEEVRGLGVRTASDSASMIRSFRDGR